MSLSDARSTLAGDAMALAVDVERDWGHGGLQGIREALPRLLELLDRYQASATFFVVGELADEVRAALDPASGHEVGSHGQTHRRLGDLSRGAARAELVESRARLTQVGYEVDGFRAPFLSAPDDLEALLTETGFHYDASLGSLYHGFGVRAQSETAPLPRLGTSSLRTGLLPYNLTWLRLLHPLGFAARPARPRMFSLHLHELLDAGGVGAGSRPLRRLHALRCGGTSWAIVERVLSTYEGKITTCRRLLSVSPSSSEPARQG